MKLKKLRSKMLISILPVIILGILIIVTISGIQTKNLAYSEISNYMFAELKARNAQIENSLERVDTTSTNLAKLVGATYSEVSMETYLKALEDIINSNDFILGSGLWFEPNIYDKNELYMGPYVYKDNNTISVTYDYSNASYDYFNQEYYLNAKNSTEAIFTDPYYDETSGLIMSTCSTPMFNAKNEFIGCITVDIELSTIEQVINNIKVGQDDHAFLLTSNGTYIVCDDPTKMTNASRITEDDNASLVEAANEILTQDDGITSYLKSGRHYSVYYDTLAKVGWKLMIQIPNDKIHSPVVKLITSLIFIAIIVVLCCNIVIAAMITKVSKHIEQVQSFATELSQGDFTVPKITIQSQDEVGQMGAALNNMYDQNKNVITHITNKASQITASSESLSSVVNLLKTQFNEVKKHMDSVNEDMMSASAATEEINASTEEVFASVNLLTTQTTESKKMSNEIKSRANKIGISSKSSYTHAKDLTIQYESSLRKSISNAHIVEDISKLAEIISSIAENINLLSLNASIEAARAGEQGRGFAVVATEIGHLANETADTVNKIQMTISEVQNAFNDLAESSSSLLSFVTDTVTPDYNQFVDIANQYEKDAVSIEELSNNVYEMSEHIREIITEVSKAIENIAETSQNTTINSSQILNIISDVSKLVDDVSSVSNTHEQISKELKNVVDNFKL